MALETVLGKDRADLGAKVRPVGQAARGNAPARDKGNAAFDHGTSVKGQPVMLRSLACRAPAGCRALESNIPARFTAGFISHQYTTRILRSTLKLGVLETRTPTKPLTRETKEGSPNNASPAPTPGRMQFGDTVRYRRLKICAADEPRPEREFGSRAKRGGHRRSGNFVIQNRAESTELVVAPLGCDHSRALKLLLKPPSNRTV